MTIDTVATWLNLGLLSPKSLSEPVLPGLSIKLMIDLDLWDRKDKHLFGPV